MTTNITAKANVHLIFLVGDECKFRHNGVERTLIGSNFTHDDPGSLRAAAVKHRQRAEEELRRAALCIEVADQKDRWAQAAADQAAKQRRERAAATRARNADPFGFKAAGYA